MIDAKLIYVTPEMMMLSNQFISVLHEIHARGQLARFVVDEGLFHLYHERIVFRNGLDFSHSIGS